LSIHAVALYQSCIECNQAAQRQNRQHGGQASKSGLESSIPLRIAAWLIREQSGIPPCPLDRAKTIAESPRHAATMLPETEQFYNNTIRQAVDRDEIDKALRLVEEAERSGSASARNSFIRALKAR